MLSYSYVFCTERRSRRNPAQKITDADYADDIAILTNSLNDATVLLHNIEKFAEEIGLYVNAEKTEFICLNQDASEGLSSLSGENLKQVDDFKYLGSFIASTERDVDIRLDPYLTDWRTG